MIAQKEDSYIVVTGDLTAAEASGHGTAVISSANTYAIYEGEWQDDTPNGDGILRVWSKNQAMENGIQYSGSFDHGLVNGEAVLNVLVDETAVDLDISVSSGSIQVFKTDEEGRVWLYDVEDNGTYIVENVEENNGMIANYSAGVPGYGGSDDMISIYYMILDKEPPVLACSLSRNYWYDGKIPIGRGITAIDNVDGDITDRITNTSTKGPTDWGAYSEWEYKLTVVYSAEDSAGNVGTLTVEYQYDGICSESYSLWFR